MIMGDRSARKKDVYMFLVVGGALVAIAFLLNWVFGPWSWRAWEASNVLHIVGGAYAFYFIRALFILTRERHRIATSRNFEALLFIAGAVIMGVIWEWYELGVDRYQFLVLGEPSMMTYADNIGDLLFDAAGAAVAAIIFLRRGKQN